MKCVSSCILLAVLVTAASAQVMTGRLEGTVTDAQGATVPGALIKVTNTQTGQTLNVAADDKGLWAIPSVPTATYTVTVSHPGFKTENIDNVKVDAGVPATVNTTLQVGALTETVEVAAGAEILQTQTATVTSTLVGRQLHELPFTSRNLTELIVTQPGSATPGVPRSTSVYGLPQAALNVTLDGINIQDNSNKSSDGFFNAIFPRADMVEEMTVSSASAGADSNAEGAYQVKMVTRSGSNDWHGGLFEQHRNQDLNANFYFNNINSQPRDHIVFNQFGGQVGGPIRRNKLFFFAAMEAFRLPQTYTEPTDTVLTPQAIQGLFRYSANGGVQTIDLYQLAAAHGFPSTPDPIISKTLSQIDGLVEGQPGLKSRIASNNDYNRNNLDFQSKGANNRNFPALRLDYNVTEKHHIEFIYNYQTNIRRPDGVNIGTASPVFPGTGNVLNSSNGEPGNQGGIAFQAVTALRSTLTPRLTSEIRFGLNGGTVIFNNGISPADFAQWRGFSPVLGATSGTTGFVTNPYRVTGQSRRNTPLKQGNVNLTYSRGAHLWNFGGSFTQVNIWTTASSGAPFVPGIDFGLASNDPVNTGATNLFTTANFPGATATNLSDAGNLYALLTGRVASITNSVVLGATSKTYGINQPIVHNQQREFGFYVQDSWRVAPGLTVNYGVRLDHENPPVNLDGVYTRPGYAGLFGISGVGNLFNPYVQTGSAPQLNLVAAGTPGYDEGVGRLSPSLGLAYQLPKTDVKPLAWLVGRNGQSVLRAGYSISTIREDAGTFSVWGGNSGRTVSTSVDPNTYPAQFGAPGSVLFNQATLPSRSVASTPVFPLAAPAGTSLNEFSPNLKLSYVQSWDIGFQRELTRDTVLEIRYIGNHGTDLWRTVNLNEVNVFENGFLNEFQVAQNNLAIANGVSSVAQLPSTGLKSTNFGNQGLPGQRPIPIIQTALNLSSDTTTATRLVQGQAGALANTIATTLTDLNRLVAAGYPLNMFQVNPTIQAADNLLENGGNSNYHGLQVEARRRMSFGLLFQASYVWSHSISNELSQGRGGSFTTLRNVGYDKNPSPYDIRQSFKANWIYELPFGSKRHFLGNVHNVVARKALEGWELASVGRIQSGSPIKLNSGRNTFNQNDSGVILHNLTASQLQSMMSIRKTTNAQGLGIVSFLPQNLIDNTLAAFETGGKTLANLDPNAPYIGPANIPGQLGENIFLYGPKQQKWDVSLVKRTHIAERFNLEFRAQALNVFNLTNFLLFTPGNGITPTSTIGSSFGQTTGAYRDLSNTNDPGGRIIEFVMRLNF
ncbi:MAG TPA: TonB-dependent receptor [Bryobacteraceae bacterium]|nr:TonB-dependent receptor [Bryobacteraceae bacterium]